MYYVIHVMDIMVFLPRLLNHLRPKSKWVNARTRAHAHTHTIDTVLGGRSLFGYVFVVYLTTLSVAKTSYSVKLGYVTYNEMERCENCSHCLSGSLLFWRFPRRIDSTTASPTWTALLAAIWTRNFRNTKQEPCPLNRDIRSFLSLL
jgi:hypothetical protein